MLKTDYPEYKRLANAIVYQAYYDLIWGYEHLYKCGEQTMRKARRFVNDCESFFNGEEVKRFTDISGKDIIKMAKANAYKEIIEAAKRIKKHCANMHYCSHCPFSNTGDGVIKCTLATTPIDYETEFWHKGVLEDETNSSEPSK